MNTIADQVFAQNRGAGLVPGGCVRAEKVCVNSNGDLDGTNGQLAYDTTPYQLADLDAKIIYAYNRWGCRIVYVANDVVWAQRAQLDATWAPAWVYTQLRLPHPDCLAARPSSGLTFRRSAAGPSAKLALLVCRACGEIQVFAVHVARFKARLAIPAYQQA